MTTRFWNGPTISTALSAAISRIAATGVPNRLLTREIDRGTARPPRSRTAAARPRPGSPGTARGCRAARTRAAHPESRPAELAADLDERNVPVAGDRRPRVPVAVGGEARHVGSTYMTMMNGTASMSARGSRAVVRGSRRTAWTSIRARVHPHADGEAEGERPAGAEEPRARGVNGVNGSNCHLTRPTTISATNGARMSTENSVDPSATTLTPTMLTTVKAAMTAQQIT